MNTTLLSRARRMFDRPDVPRKIVRHNIRQWSRSVRHLGGKWLIAEPIQRQTVSKPCSHTSPTWREWNEYVRNNVI